MRGWIAACLIAGTGLVAVGAHGQSDLPSVSVRASMVDHINPGILGVWDVTNDALGDDGALDPALMDSAAWAKLAESAAMLHSGAALLAEQPKLEVVAGDAQPIAVSAFTAEEIQAFIDADPDAFRAMARALSISAAGLAEAARAQDGARAGELADQVNALCETCHQKFWYPDS